jgi:hypothetical protein
VIIVENNCKEKFLDIRLHGPAINSIFLLQSYPACKPDAHVKLETGPGFVGRSRDSLSDLFSVHARN